MGNYTELILGTVDDFYENLERKRKQRKRKPKEFINLISKENK